MLPSNRVCEWLPCTTRKKKIWHLLISIFTTRRPFETLLTLKVLGWSVVNVKDAHLFCVLQCADMVGHGDKCLVSAVGYVEPPPLLLLLWEVQAVRRMRHLGLGLQQGSLPALDALLQSLPLLTGTGGEQEVNGWNSLHPTLHQQFERPINSERSMSWLLYFDSPLNN